ncbi:MULTISPECIES: GntR family transcriptional regulator [unclassified Streptomyces]|uniref:GntR family transcriptional regulator n=1 Tax=unclassified Streptomyces TaxID=2593676 RepID=UPI0036E4C944
MVKPGGLRRDGGEVLDELRADILAGRLAPGTRLKFSELTQRLECSVASLREALIALSGEWLVQAERNRGFRVTPVSPEALVDLGEVRVDLETTALRRAIERGGPAWEMGVLQAQHELEAVPLTEVEGGPIAQLWYERHERLHQVLLSGCGNGRLLSMADTVRSGFEVYWRALEPLPRGSTDQLNAEHRAIVLPALARQADTAVEALKVNILATLAPMLDALRAGSRA